MIGTFGVVWAVGWLGITTAQTGLALVFTLLFMAASSPWRSRAAPRCSLERIAYRPLAQARRRPAGVR